MRSRLRTRLAIEAPLTAVAVGLLLFTLVDPEWIESITGTDPDSGSGLLEWAIVAVFAIAAVGLSALTVRDGRRLMRAT